MHLVGYLCEDYHDIWSLEHKVNLCVICALMTSDHSISHFCCPTHPEPLLFSLLLGPSSAHTSPFPDIIKL
jgi:hypothetical protein